MIRFFNKEINFNLKRKTILKNWLKGIVEGCEKRVGDINVIFCSDENLLEINKQFLNHDYYTDIITFDYCEGDIVSGELYISIDSVKANAVEYQQEFLVELHRVISHGVLHLCGYDDHSDDDIAQMRAAENRALDKLNEMI